MAFQASFRLSKGRKRLVVVLREDHGRTAVHLQVRGNPNDTRQREHAEEAQDLAHTALA